MEALKTNMEFQEAALNSAYETISKLLKQTPPRKVECLASFQVYKDEFDQYLEEADPYLAALRVEQDSKEHGVIKRKVASHKTNFLVTSGTIEVLFPKPAAQPQQQQPIMNKPKLPPPQLPKFDGDVREWMNFWSLFKRYHDDPQIVIMDKYQLLIQSIVPGSKAHKVIQPYPICEANYPNVIADLENAFGKKSVRIKVYVRELLNLAIENSAGRKADFDDVVTKITSQIRHLESLGVTKDTYAQILYPVVESCLPEQTYEAWQRTESDEELDLLLDFLQKEVSRKAERSLARNQFGSPAKTTSPTDKTGKGNKNSSRPSSPSSPTTSFASTSGVKVCVFCQQNHNPSVCGKAFLMSLNKKKEILKAKGCCLRCFRPGHELGNCSLAISCDMCGKPHYKVMCYLLEEKPAPASTKSRSTGATRTKKEDSKPKKVTFTDESDSEEVTATSVSADMKATEQSCEVPLQTLLTYAFGPDGKKKRVRVMFDSGAQKSYILSSIAMDLDLKEVRPPENTIHQLFGGAKSELQQHGVFKLFLGNKNGTKSGNFDVRSTEVISHHISSPLSGPWIQQFEKLGVSFSDVGNSKQDVDVLIGNDVRPHCFTGKRVKLHNGPGPVAEETLWGWVLSGKVPSSPKYEDNTMLVTNLQIADLPISDLWSLETIGIRDADLKDSREEMDKKVIQHFNETVSQHNDGRYEVGLPWLQGMKKRLPNNYFACVKRLKTTTTQLQKSGYLDKYHQVFQQWTKDNMIEVITVGGAPEEHQAQYLPHRAVIKESSSTTPVRPVFDASANLKGHPSLNECVDKGANLLELIPSILTRFRENKIAVTADIRKAFQMISVKPEDRDYLRFLWWEDESCKKIQLFRHTRVVFGVSASPFLLGITLQYHIGKHQKDNDCDDETLAALHKLVHDMYVDNLVSSFQSMKLARKFHKKAIEILLPAQFDLRDWIFGPNNNDEEVPVLGLLWNTMHDTLRIDITAALQKLEEKNITQRSLLSLVHCLFDPLGFITPYVLIAKLILRGCHQLKLGWDTSLPLQLQQDVRKWGADLYKLQQCKVPRYSFMGEAKNISFHVFCDASGSAYAAAVFVRVEFNDRVEVMLIQSRARVAPQKKCTIPRLELISCTIGARLYNSVMDDLNMRSYPVIFWTDSTTAWTWIIGIGPWGVFVNNRKSEINQLTEISAWRHVPGKLNPADLPSRGCSASKLVESQWWGGTSWLRLAPSEWPSSSEKADPLLVEAELRKTVVTFTVADESHPLQGLLRLSWYPKILRVITHVVRFKRAVRDRIQTTETTPNIDDIDLTSEAENVLLRHIQQQLEHQPKSLIRLRPFKDQYGVIRTRTRLTHDDEENFKAPIILPNRNEFVSLIIRWEHENNCHIGTEMLLAHLRERYWIVNGRKTIRNIIHSCWICKRFLTRPLEVPEAPLPSARTELNYVFATIGVDAAGPIILRNKNKVWIILFTCAVYRAVHLEVVEALSTDAFLRAFRDFVKKRARPQVVYSDNGLNFVGAQRAIVNLDWAKVLEYAHTNRMQWRFNTPTAAWHGGFFERMIGVVKGLLKRVLGKRTVHLQELVSLCVEVEEAVNNRPITYISEDPEDPQPLTPNHFVKNLDIPASLPEADVIEGHHLRAAYRKLQHLREALRSRFRKEYIGQLLHNNGSSKVDVLQPNDVVLVKHEHHKRQDWQLATIISPIPSQKDGIPRSYNIWTKGMETSRPAQHLCPMEVAEDTAVLMRKKVGESFSTSSAQST